MVVVVGGVYISPDDVVGWLLDGGAFRVVAGRPTVRFGGFCVGS